MVTLQLRKRGVKTDSNDCSGAKLYHAAANTIRIYIYISSYINADDTPFSGTHILQINRLEKMIVWQVM